MLKNVTYFEIILDNFRLTAKLQRQYTEFLNTLPLAVLNASITLQGPVCVCIHPLSTHIYTHTHT